MNKKNDTADSSLWDLVGNETIASTNEPSGSIIIIQYHGWRLTKLLIYCESGAGLFKNLIEKIETTNYLILF